MVEMNKNDKNEPHETLHKIYTKASHSTSKISWYKRNGLKVTCIQRLSNILILRRVPDPKADRKKVTDHRASFLHSLRSPTMHGIPLHMYTAQPAHLSCAQDDSTPVCCAACMAILRIV